jgi:hypothetical protein
MTLNNVQVTGNTTNGNGGGLANVGSGHLNLIDTTVSGNSAFNGGGIYNIDLLTIVGSTVENNTASNGGGGIFNGDGGLITISVSAVINNTAVVDGGGIWNDGLLNITGSDLMNNSTDQGLFGGGGGIWNAFTGAVTLVDTNCQANRANGSTVDVFNNGGRVENQTDCEVVF